MAWADETQAREHWPDANAIDDATLIVLLEVATVQCEAYAPVRTDIPNNYMLATVYQAKEVYEQGRRSGDVIGFDVYAIRAKPLGSSVKTLLRPIEGNPAVG